LRSLWGIAPRKRREIHGSVLAAPGDEAAAVPLADFPIQLKNGEGRTVETARTDGLGRYRFHRQPPGEYRLGWKSEKWGEGGSKKPIRVTSQTRYPDPIVVKPSAAGGSERGKLSGVWQMADGRPPAFSNELFGAHQTAMVYATNPDGEELPGTRTQTNAWGEFVMTDLPRGNLNLHANLIQRLGDSSWTTAYGARADALMISSERLAAKTLARVIGRFQKPCPKVVAEVWFEDRKVDRVPPGKWVECRARVEGAGNVEYWWKVPGYDKATSHEAVLRWPVPRWEGNLRACVLASTEDAGFGMAQVSFAVANPPPEPIKAPAPAAAPDTPPIHLPVAQGEPGFFLTMKGVGSDQIADFYYRTVDPQGLRETLDDWLRTNHFRENLDDQGVPKDEIRLAYLNNNDLGFGRDMHLLKHKDGISAYVTNYGDPPGDAEPDPTDADRASDHLTSDGQTVCMEYSRLEGHPKNPPIVKFFVYDTSKNGGKRLTSANLDKGGGKFVPNLCLNCHGGEFDFRAGDFLGDVTNQKYDEQRMRELVARNDPAELYDAVNMDSSFREFDVASFKFARPGKGPKDPSRLVPTQAELDQFNRMNDLVVESWPKDGIKQLVKGWKSAGWKVGNGLVFSSLIPPDWQVDSAVKRLYLEVVSKSCRTCHVAFPTDQDLGDGEGLNWTSYDQFHHGSPIDGDRRRFVESHTFNPTRVKVMPNARVTYQNFRFRGNPKTCYDRLGHFDHNPDWLRIIKQGPVWPGP
jgi:hypothetical protein